jgi:hypothetical protein
MVLLLHSKEKRAMRSNIEGAILADNVLLNGNRWGAASITITATYAIPPDAPHVMFISAAAPQNVTLPASPQLGDFFFIFSTGAGALAVQNSAGGALVPPLSVATNTAAMVVWNGTLWKKGSFA